MTSDREPSAFPRVGEPVAGGSDTGGDAPLFTSEDQRRASAEALSTAPVSRSSGGGGRLRWLIAGVATVAVFAVVAAVLVLAGPRAGTPSVVEYYVPADAAAYVDVRLDMPGDQHDNMAQFMSHFPGFADPAAFDQKIDEMLDQALQSADAGLSWQADVEPWFGGQVAFFGETLSPAEGTPPSVVAALTVKDRAALEELLNDRLVDHQVDTLDYQGQQVRSFTPDPGSQRVSIVVTDEVLLVSPSIEDIQTALDVKAGVEPALAQDAFYLQQLGALNADRLATAYVDMGRLMESMQGAAGGSPVDMFGGDCLADLQSGSQVKYVAEVRAEDDHLAVTTRSQPPSGANVPPLPQNRTTTLAASMPADALAYAEFRQVGAGAEALITGFLECMDESEDLGVDPRMLEQLLGVPPQDYLDFVDDAAVAITYSDELPGGGLIATVDDETVARQRVERLLSSLRALVALGGGDEMQVDEIEHNGATITVFTFEDVAPDMPSMSLAVTVANGRLYIGLNDFVTEALDRQQQDSLAATERFGTAVVATGDNAGVMYLDMARARQVLEEAMPADDRAGYDGEARPFIEPLTTVAMVSRVDNGILVGNIFLYVE